MNSRWIRCMISILIDLRLALEPVISSITTGYNQAICAATGTGAGRGELVIVMHNRSLAQYIRSISE